MLIAVSGCGEQANGPSDGPPPVPVRVATAQIASLPIHLNALGTVTPLNAVTVRSRIDGELINVAFEEGQFVKEGQLLAQIDPRPFRVALAQAEGQQQEGLALLLNAEAELKRFEDLHARKFIPRQQLTNQESLVLQYRARIKTNDANVENARLQLSYTKLVAPLSGRIGLRNIDPGNLIRSSDAEGLATITQMDPITVVFTIPETELQPVLTAVRSDRELRVEAWDRDQTEQLAVGVLASLDNSIDTATGTLKLKARFDNQDGRLFPSQFVNARLHVRDLEQVVIIPGASVQYGARGNYVFAVNEQNRVSIRPVVLGPASAEQVVVTKGLEGGDRVVLEGLDRLREGREIEVIEGDDPRASVDAS